MGTPDLSPAAIAQRLANAPPNGSLYNLQDYLAAGNDPSANNGQGGANLATMILGGNRQYQQLLQAAKNGDANAQAELPITAQQLLEQGGFDASDMPDLSFGDPTSPDYGVGKDENTGFNTPLAAGIVLGGIGSEELPGLFAGGDGTDAATAGADVAGDGGGESISAVGGYAGPGASSVASGGGGGSSLLNTFLGGGANKASNVPSLINAGGSFLKGLFTPQREGFTGANDPQQLLSQYESNSNEIGNALRERAGTPITMPGASISTPRVSIPGLNVPNLGGTDINVKPYTQPGLDLSGVFGQPPSLVPPGFGKK